MKRMPRPAGLQVAEQVEDVDPGRGVEHADDLVRHEQADIEEQSARDEHALQLTAAQLMGVLPQDVSRVEAHGAERLLELRVPLGAAELREVPAAQDREDAVCLEDRVVGAERVLEDALHVAVVRLEPAAAERGDVDAVEGDRPAGHPEQPEDHLPDGRLAAAALADERHDLARSDLEADVADGLELAAAERADPVRPAAGVETQHQAAAFQQAAV